MRLTHWLFVLCIAVSWWSAEQRAMDWHRYSGYTLLGLLIFRIYWGFVGSSSARFSNFVRGPGKVVAYLRGMREEQRTAGHNPLGGWSVAALLTLMLTQALLGLFVSDVDGLESGPLSHLVSFDTSRALAEIHEALFNFILALIALHVAAILFYLLAKRDNLLVAMITGRRREAGSDVRMTATGGNAGKAWSNWQQTPMIPVPAWRVIPGIALAAGVVWWVAN